MIEEILPPSVVVAEAFDDAEDAVLFPEEEAAVSAAVNKRRQEFTTARICARKALAELGLPAAAIVPGERGQPQWPPGIVGSMTHCCGYRAAALARTTEVVTIGLDAEPDGALPDGVLDVVAAAGEQASLAQLGAASTRVSFDRLLFSAKESVYKAWFPLTGQWLGFKDVEVTISPADGRFTVALLVPGPVVNGSKLTSFAGRWLARNGLVVTAIAVPVARS